MSIQFPMLHKNGSSKESLQNDLREAAMKVNDAIFALARCVPHNRDYYLINSTAGELAFEQHRARIHALQNVYNELSAIYKWIENQQP